MADRIDPKNNWEIENKDNSDRRASPLGELIAEIDRELPTGPNLIPVGNEGGALNRPTAIHKIPFG
jgi:hypothetical protein